MMTQIYVNDRRQTEKQMISTIVNGKVLDWHFKKRDMDTLFYIGDIFIGHLFKIGPTWSIVGAHPTDGLCPIDGFATRRDAAECLLTLEGYNKTKGNGKIAKTRELRDKYPGLKDLWNQYQTMLNLCIEQEL